MEILNNPVSTFNTIDPRKDESSSPLEKKEDASSNSSVYLGSEDDKDQNNETNALNSQKKKYHNIPNDVRLKLIDAVENKGEKIKHVAKRLSINYSSAKSICQVFKREGRSKKKSIKKRPIKEESKDPVQKNFSSPKEETPSNFTINHLLNPHKEVALEKNTSAPDTLTQLKNRLLENRNNNNNNNSGSNLNEYEHQPYKKLHTQQPNEMMNCYSSTDANQLQQIDRIIAQNNQILNDQPSINSSANPQTPIVYAQNPPSTFQHPNFNMGQGLTVNTMRPNFVPNFKPMQGQPMVMTPNGQMPVMYVSNPSPSSPYPQQQMYPMNYQGGYPQNHNGEAIIIMNNGVPTSPMPMYQPYNQQNGFQQPSPMFYQAPQPMYMQQHQPQQQQMGGYYMPQPVVYMMPPGANNLMPQNGIQAQNFMSNEVNYVPMQAANSMNKTPIVQPSSAGISSSQTGSGSDSSDNKKDLSSQKKMIIRTIPQESSAKKEQKDVKDSDNAVKRVIFNSKSEQEKKAADFINELKSKGNQGFMSKRLGLKILTQNDKVVEAE